MGEAKRRQAEIEFLKSLSPEEARRWQQAKEDEKRLDKGIDPGTQSPALTAAMIRELTRLLESAKGAGSVDEPVAYLHSRVDATIRAFTTVPVACAAGCSYCCRGLWVGVSAMEAISIAKAVAQMGPEAIAEVRKSHAVIKDLPRGTPRPQGHPCPMLKNNQCSIYEDRPQSCRLAASGDAQVCARTCHGLTDEKIPVPNTHEISRVRYALALIAALNKANLKDSFYEFSAAILHVLDTPDAEGKWLAGEDVFAGVLGENMPFGEEAQSLAKLAFKDE